MPLPRQTVLRSGLRVPGARASGRSRFVGLGQRLSRRGYASGGDAPKKASGDLPWLIGSIAVTVPTCAYLLQAGPDKSHHDHDGSHDHHEAQDSHDESESEGSEDDDDNDQKDAGSGKEDEDGAQETEGEQDDGNGGGDEAANGDEQGGSGKRSPVEDGFDETDKSENIEKDAGKVKEEGSGVEGVRFKGATKDGPAADERRLIPDNKGGNKRRINSSYGKSLGQPDDGNPEDEGEPGTLKDKGKTSKKALDRNHQSGKQEGISNTDTKHSTEIDKMPDKSKKAEGGPETAKVKGTVRTDRPPPEQINKDN